MPKEINSKEDLYFVLDEMILSIPKGMEAKEINICESLINFDADLKEKLNYKGLNILVYKKWLANKKIVII
jgi:hypothetical protein